MLCIVENLGLKHEMFDGKPQNSLNGIWYFLIKTWICMI